VQESRHALPGVACGLGPEDIGAPVVHERVARIGVDDDFGRHLSRREPLFQPIDVGHRNELVLGSKEAQQRAEQVGDRIERLPWLLHRIEPPIRVQQAVLV